MGARSYCVVGFFMGWHDISILSRAVCDMFNSTNTVHSTLWWQRR